MTFWRSGLVVNLLLLAVLLAAVAWIRREVPFLRRLAIPDALSAGALGLVLGPSVCDILPLSSDDLEPIVYHLFAVVFIAVALQAPTRAASGAARSVAVLIPTFSVLQVVLGLGLVLVFAAISVDAHPGFGLMILLGFQNGPGQALALGTSWEPLGLPDGGQIGLIFAAFGFAYCCLIGVPLLLLGRHLGWADQRGFAEVPPEPEQAVPPPPVATPGGMEPLTTQLVAVGCVYAFTYGFLLLATEILPAGSAIASTLWGFHFIVGSITAISVRALARRTGFDLPLDDGLLARISVVAVDFTTAAALAAVQLAVLERWLGPILAMTAVAAVVIVVVCVWFGRRAFPNAPFSHTVAMFGAATGTLATGLALLRGLDPDLRGPAARNMVLGVTASVPLTAPLMLGVLPYAVSLWPEPLTTAAGVPLAILAAYLAALVVAFRVFTPFRLLRPLRRLWPEPER